MATQEENLDFDFELPSVADPILSAKHEDAVLKKDSPKKATRKKKETDAKEEVTVTSDVEDTESKKEEGKKYSQEELLAVFDDILFKGEYRESFKIGGKLNVVFRSRSASEMATISRTLDSMNFQLISTMEDQRFLLTLSYSLEEYNGKNLTGMSPNPDKYKFIGSLPAPIIGALMDRLTEFDRKVFLAIEEAEKNF